MTFKITSTAVIRPRTVPAESDEFWTWTLETKDGERICRCAKVLSSEKEARSDIASAKTAMKGARFAKVEGP